MAKSQPRPSVSSSEMIDATSATAPPSSATPLPVSPGREVDRTTRPLRLGGRLLGGRHDAGPIGMQGRRHTAYGTASSASFGSPGGAGLIGVAPQWCGVQVRVGQLCGLRQAWREIDRVRSQHGSVDHLQVVELAGT